MSISSLPPGFVTNTKWEYKVEYIKDDWQLNMTLANLGLQGWELVSVVEHRDKRGEHTMMKMFFKRLLPI